MENLDSIGFKFKVGDIVYHRLKTKKEFKEGENKTPLLIVERLAQECSGGIQLQYRVRVGVSSHTVSFDPQYLATVQEIEVEA